MLGQQVLHRLRDKIVEKSLEVQKQSVVRRGKHDLCGLFDLYYKPCVDYQMLYSDNLTHPLRLSTHADEAHIFEV